MAAKDPVIIQLDTLGKSVVKAAKKSLSRLGYSATKRTGRLYKSLTYNINVRSKTLTWEFVYYGHYLDSSPRYHSRQMGGSINRKLKSGRTSSYKTKGNKTMGWFTNPFNIIMKNFPKELEQSLHNYINSQVDNLYNKK